MDQDKISKLQSVIEKAEARNLEAKQLKQKANGSPDLKKKELELYLCVHSAETLAYIVAMIDMGKSNLGFIDFNELLPYSTKSKKQLLESIFNQYYALAQRKTKDKLVDLIMKETELPTLIRDGMKIVCIEE
jgi:hypothetical protein